MFRLVETWRTMTSEALLQRSTSSCTPFHDSITSQCTLRQYGDDLCLLVRVTSRSQSKSIPRCQLCWPAAARVHCCGSPFCGVRGCALWPPRCHGGGGSRQTWSVIARYPRTTWRRSSPYCDNVVCDRMGPVYMTRCSVAIETSGDIMHRVSTTRNMSTSTKSMSANIADVSSPRQPGQRTACAQTARREAPQRTLKPDCGGEWCG